MTYTVEGITITRVTPQKESPKTIPAVPPGPPVNIDAATARTLAAIGVGPGVPEETEEEKAKKREAEEKAKAEAEAGKAADGDKGEEENAAEKKPEVENGDGGGAQGQDATKKKDGEESKKASEGDAEGDDDEEEDKPKRRRRRNQIDQLTHVSEKLTEVADKISKKADPSPAAAAAAPVQHEDTSDLDPEDVVAMQFLQENDARFKGRNLIKETRAWNDKFEAYQEKWEKAHPEEEFDEDSKEAQQWLAANRPPVEQRHLDRAYSAYMSRETVRRELDADREQRRLEKVTEVSTIESNEAIAHLSNEVKKLAKDDPDAAFLIHQSASRVGSLVQLAAFARNYGIEATRSQELAQWVSSAEAAISQASPAEQVAQGRRFATVAEKQAMPPDQAIKFWSVLDYAKILMVSAEVARAKEHSRKRSEMLRQWQGDPGEASGKASETPPTKKQDGPAAGAGNASGGTPGAKPKPPGGGTGGLSSPSGNPKPSSGFSFA